MIDDGVEVKRTIEERPAATVVMYRLETVTSRPSVVRLEEAIPPEDRIETLEFHPNHRPNDWTIGEETVQFDVMIPPNETRSVVLGIDADVEEVFGGDEPKITNLDSETIDLDESTESVPLTRGGDTGSPEDDASGVLGLDTDTVANGGDAVDVGVGAGGEDAIDAVAGDATPEPDSDDVPDSDDPTEVGLDPTAEGPERPSNTENADDTDDADGSVDDDITYSETDDAEESAGEASDSAGPDATVGPEDGDASAEDAADGDADDNADAVDDVDVVDTPTGEPMVEETVEAPEIGEPVDEVDTAETSGMVDPSVDSQAGDGIEDGTGDGIGIEADDDHGSADGFDGMEPTDPVDGSQVDSATPDDADSLVGNLLAEIEAGHASEDELDALRSELGVARADEVRFRHVQSRMDDFEAYVDALEGIINSHGTASEFVDSIEREVTDLQDQISAVRSEVSAVDDELEAADGDREQLTEEVSAVDDRVVELDETMTGLSDEVAELTDLVGTVDDRTATLEADLRAELDDVSEELDDVHAELDETRDERDQEIERIEAELETVREQLESDFETEFDSLREDVESLNEVRRSLLDAFGGGLDPTIDDDSTVGEES